MRQPLTMQKFCNDEKILCDRSDKMHYAVHGHTAAELIVERADHTKEHMGLTTWADAPDGKIKKSDVTVAKNYLSQDEMKQLNRMVTAYLDFCGKHDITTYSVYDAGLGKEAQQLHRNV